MYPTARTPVRFPLEWLGKPHGGLENITEQQNNNARGGGEEEGRGTTEGTDAEGRRQRGRGEPTETLGRSQPNIYDD